MNDQASPASSEPEARRRPPPSRGLVLARAALSRIMEPSDLPGMALIKTLGPWDSMRVITGHLSLSNEQQGEIAQLLEVAAGKEWHGPEEPLRRWRPRLPDLAPERDLRVIASLAGGLLIPESEYWPSGFHDLGLSEPIALWYRGKALQAGSALPEKQQSIALVGSRDASGYGENAAAELAQELVLKGKTVISGGAYGIDAAAHRAALAAQPTGRFPTIAMMAGGLDRLYPAGNEDLLRAVADSSVLLAEVPPGSNPTRYRFLQRNRLIAALSGAVVVVEARWRSGALSTAHHAANLGREVGAVPGPISSPQSAGCHRLLREGAACVTDADEVLELVAPLGGLTGQRARTAEGAGLPVEDLLLLDALPLYSTTTVQKLARVAGLSEAEVLAGLGRLELQEFAQRRGQGWCRDHPQR
ncbi:DNA-processing protein DprA [Psychromicrobium sp. YIM B11713]|uniref:DNA-processing protein DprA n=1 Tax=Psychromicrobium sp. YIM B11713 TaxID=3145233 RepID=UPI00374FAC05